MSTTGYFTLKKKTNQIPWEKESKNSIILQMKI